MRALCPVVGEDGLMRVGGRINQPHVEGCSTHQILLPKQHHICDLIVREHHERSGHSGCEHTLAQLRMTYWIIGARRIIKKLIRNCIVCRKRAAIPCQQKMAALPDVRVLPREPPFSNSGVDVFGPYEVKYNRSSVKRYGCLFTCMASRAIHIELLYTLDTSSFIDALRRFIARRGEPKTMWSDNGSNFVGADNELRKGIHEWNQHCIDNYLKQREVQWLFNPPSSPHMGGVWERMIRSTKIVLSTLLKKARLTDETLATVFCEVEAIVNSRPLTSVSTDVNDLEALTPAHLLLLRTSSTLPPGIFIERDSYVSKRWRNIQYLVNEFWSRWIREYLPTLQRRTKWLKSSRNLREGDLVLIIEDCVARSQWPIARVIRAHEGPDGLVRSVELKTAATTLTRPVAKLCLLEGFVDDIA